jgi:hypothetical protein
MARNTNDLRSLRNIIAEAHDILRTTALPEARSQRAYVLTAAIYLADNLLEVSPPATLGSKAGNRPPNAGRITSARSPLYTLRHCKAFFRSQSPLPAGRSCAPVQPWAQRPVEAGARAFARKCQLAFGSPFGSPGLQPLRTELILSSYLRHALARVQLAHAGNL